MLPNSVIGHVGPAALEHARTESEKHLTMGFQAHASAQGWPDNVVRHLSVRHDGTRFQTHVDDEVAPQALDLEYGTLNTMPNAAMRQFQSRLPHQASAAVMTSLSRALDTMGGVL